MSRLPALAAAAMLLGLGAAPAAANAAPITETFAFTATGFPGNAPFPTISGSATVTFDPAVNQPLTPLPSFTSNLPPSYGPASFIYGSSLRELAAGNNCDAGCEVFGGFDQFTLAFFVDPAGLPTSGVVFAYANTAFPSTNFSATSLSVSLIAVPEPASLMLLATGLLGLPFAVRRRA